MQDRSDPTGILEDLDFGMYMLHVWIVWKKVVQIHGIQGTHKRRAVFFFERDLESEYGGEVLTAGPQRSHEENAKGTATPHVF